MDEKKLTSLDKAYSAYSVVTKVCNAIGIIAVYIMMFIIVLDVIFRNFMPSPLQGIYEIVQWFLLPISCISFFGYAYASGIMPRVTMLLVKLKPPVRRVISIASLILNVGMFSLMSYAAVVYAVKQMNKSGVVTIGTEHIAVWPMYYVIVLAFVMIVFECLFALIKTLKTADRAEVTYDE